MTQLETKNTARVRPNIHNLNNRLSAADIFKEYTFPDVDLTEEMHPQAEFSMSQGEFVEVYGKTHGRVR